VSDESHAEPIELGDLFDFELPDFELPDFELPDGESSRLVGRFGGS
jgi:hypothetical protein